MSRGPIGPNRDPEKIAASATRALFERQEAEYVEGLYLDDVRSEIDEFEADARFLERDGGAFPMQHQREGLVPVALRYLRPGFQLTRRAEEEIQYIPVPPARDRFRNLVSMFVTSRVRGVFQFFDSFRPFPGAFVANFLTLTGKSSAGVGC